MYSKIHGLDVCQAAYVTVMFFMTLFIMCERGQISFTYPHIKPDRDLVPPHLSVSLGNIYERARRLFLIIFPNISEFH